MNKNLFKKFFAFLMVAAMVFSMVACSSDSGSSDNDGKKKTEKEEEAPEVTKATSIQSDDLAYVMIYNPAINVYKEYEEIDGYNYSTGTLSDQIEVDMDRGDGLEEDTITLTSPLLNIEVDPSDLDLEANRGDNLGIEYSFGDTKEFFTYVNRSDNREKVEMTCVYEGEYCYVWNPGDYDDEILVEYGETFDEDIYGTLTDLFGEPRFVGEKGKVNIFFASMNPNYGGCVLINEIYTSKELPKADKYTLNTDHTIVYINGDYANNPANKEAMCSTIAHELQHAVAGATGYTQDKSLSIWLNEAMSGYIERVLYGQDMKTENVKDFNSSEVFRNGQSLYNFYQDQRDWGRYGIVYLFTEYLADLTGEDIFSDIHAYWRNSYSDTLNEAEAFANCVSKSAKKEINNSITYPEHIKFNNENEEFQSKLTLNFHLSVLAKELSAYKDVKPKYMVYDQYDDAVIEGGGRIIVAVNSDTFEIPEDADEGLVYVGLDSDFNVVTDFIFS